MKFGTDKKTGEFVALVEKTDWQEVSMLADMLKHPGWVWLCDQNKKSREAIIESIKESTKKKSLAEMLIRRASKLDGFDQAQSLADNFVEQMKVQINDELIGDKNGNNDAGND